MTKNTRRSFLRQTVLATSGLVLAACQPKIIEKVVKETVIVAGTPQVVEKVVKETVIVAGAPQVVEKVVEVTPQEKAPKPPVTLTFHHIEVTNYADFTKLFNEQFVHPLYPHLKFEYILSPSWDEYPPKLLAMQAAGTIGDICYSYTPDWLATMTAKEIFCDHKPLADADNFDFGPYFPVGITSCTLREQLVSLPWHGHAGHSTHAINLNLFEEAGVKPPPSEPPYEWDIQEELDWGPKLTKKAPDGTMIYGRTLAGRNSDEINCLCNAWGAKVLSDDGRQAMLGSDEARAALKWVYDRAFTHKYAPSEVLDERALFQSGYFGAWQIAASRTAAALQAVGNRFKMGLAIFPTGPAGASGAIFCVNTMGITNACKNKQDAWDALKMHCGPIAGVQKVLYGAGTPGARYDCFQHPEILKKFPGAKVVQYQMEHAVADPIPWNWRVAEFRSALTQTIEEIWLGKATVDEGIDKTVAALDGILKMDAL